MLDQHRQYFNCIRPHDELVMVSTDVLGNAARVMKLAEVLLFKTDRKSFHAIGRFLGHQSDDGAGINATRKKGSERHFRHQANAHGFAQQIGTPDSTGAVLTLQKLLDFINGVQAIIA